jgi:hypothetical protein
MGRVRCLKALAQGELIGPDAWTGEALSVHARAINVLRADGLVVSLVARVESMTAMSVCVPDFFDEPPLEGAVGRAVAGDAQRIEVAEVASLELAGSWTWKGTVDQDLLRDFSMAHIAEIRDELLLHGRAGGLQGIFITERGTDPFVEKAGKALLNKRLEDLVGLGPGLTPAGDDFLVGALMASPGGTRGLFSEAVLSGTTPAGRTLLWMALRGSFPAYLVAFAGSIVRSRSAKQISTAVRAACAHGETSGSDALAGFCWAQFNYSALPSRQPSKALHAL